MRNELFEFEGERGSRLIGKLDLPDGPPHSYALFAHCFTCTKESLAAVRIGRALAGQGIGVLAAGRAMRDASIEPALLIGHSLGGAAVLAAAADLPNVKAIATIGAPFDVQHVTRLFGEDLQTLLELGEAEVKLGGRSEGRVEILSGLQPGERIVISGNFLIDSESQLKTSLGGAAK